MAKRVRDDPLEDALEDIQRDGLLGDAFYWVFGNDGVAWTNWFHRVIKPRFGFDLGDDFVVNMYHTMACVCLMELPKGPRKYRYDSAKKTTRLRIKEDGTRKIIVKSRPGDVPVWNREKVEAILEPLMIPPTPMSTDFIRKLTVLAKGSMMRGRLQCILNVIDHIMVLEAAGYEKVDFHRASALPKGERVKVNFLYTLKFGDYSLIYHHEQGIKLCLERTGFPLDWWTKDEQPDILAVIRLYEDSIGSFRQLRDDLVNVVKAMDDVSSKSRENDFKDDAWTMWKEQSTHWQVENSQSPVGFAIAERFFVLNMGGGTRRYHIRANGRSWGPYLAKGSLSDYHSGIDLLHAMGVPSDV